MSDDRERGPALVQGSAVVTLAAAVACALAGDAFASRVPTQLTAGEPEFSARVSTIVERIRLGEPSLLRELPADAKIAQWRN